MYDISIIITSYNKGTLLERAVRSALGQVLIRRTHEVIVVDDASTDGSLEGISDLFDSIKVIRNDSNLGVAAASNVGINASTGRYWMRVDADDYLSQMALQYMSAILDANPDVSSVSADHLVISQLGTSVERVSLAAERMLLQHGAGQLFRRSLVSSYGGYDEGLRNGEDFDLIARFLSEGAHRFHLPLPLYRYYKQIDGLTFKSDRGLILKKLGEKYGYKF